MEMIYKKQYFRLFLILTFISFGFLTACVNAEVDPPQETDFVNQERVDPTNEPDPQVPEETKEVATEANQDVPPPTEQSGPLDPELIEALWQTSPHANTFITDEAGRNNDCARCHSPINWAPTLKDLPESCFTCKFELDDPPSYIDESKWENIPCMVCHEVDKRGNVQPEYSWLEIAPLGEYSPVGSSTELCMKCHETVNVSEHVAVELGGTHQEEGLVCTDCHDAHELNTSCGTSDCHADVLDPETPIPGHDEDHSEVSCWACHDASGLEIGLDDETGKWVTFANWTYETDEISETGKIQYISHTLILEVDCHRCHYEGNPWQLEFEIETP
jgi:hypothetical protein